MFDLNGLISLAQQFRNPMISDELSRVQGVVPPRERVSYYGSKWGFAFFSRSGRFLGVPESSAVASVRGCTDLAGADAMWRKIAGL